MKRDPAKSRESNDLQCGLSAACAQYMPDVEPDFYYDKEFDILSPRNAVCRGVSA
jgi:hypothetical protein